MSAKSHERGHKTFYDGKMWRYVDTGKYADGRRACDRCGEPPTPDGYDACMGHVQGATSACCGHGASKPIMIMREDGNE